MASTSGTAVPVEGTPGAAAQLSPSRLLEQDRRRTAIVVVHVLLTGALVLLWQALPALSSNASQLVYPISVVVTLLFLWTCWSWIGVGQNLFSPYGFFLVCLWVFNAGQVFLEAAGQEPGGPLQGLYPDSFLLSVTLVVALVIMGVHAGALWAVFSEKRRSTAEVQSVRDAGNDEIRARALLYAGYALLLVSAPFAVRSFISGYHIAQQAGYGAIYLQRLSHPVTGISSGPTILANLLLPAALLLVAASERKGRLPLAIGVGTTVLFSASELVLGYRYQALMSVIVLFWLLRATGRRIPRELLIVLGIGALLVSPAIDVVRHTAGAQRLDPQFWLQAFVSSGNPVVTTLDQMGRTMFVVGDTMLLVPSHHGYDFGMAYIGSLTAALPNLLWRVHPGQVWAYSNWFAPTVSLGYYNQGGGYGFSFVAEAFINFGPYLAAAGAVVIGYIYARITRWGMQTQNLARIALMATVIYNCSEWGRSEAFEVFRGFFWYSLAPFLLVVLLERQLRKRAEQEEAQRPAASRPVLTASGRADA